MTSLIHRSRLPVIVIAFISLFIWQADKSAATKSATFDEAAHITAGYSYWLTGEFRLNPQNGLFPQVLAALPLVAQDIPFPGDQKAWAKRDVWSLSDQLFHESNRHPDNILRLSRRAMIALSAITGLVVFLWSRMLWGNAGAILSLGLFTLSPTVLAHSRLATSDMAASLGFLLATAAIWMLAHKISITNILVAGSALALLALSKMSAVLIIPMAFCILLVRHYSHSDTRISTPVNTIFPYRRPLYIATTMLTCSIAIIIINLAYVAPSDPMLFDWGILNQAPVWLGAPLEWIHDIGILPDSYLYGFTHTIARTSSRLSFANGEFSLNGWWWFFPFAFLVKTPLTIIVTAFFSGWLLLKQLSPAIRGARLPSSSYQALPLIILIFIYSLIAIFSHLNIGHRHLLPVYPALFILSGVIVRPIVNRKYLYVAIIFIPLAFESFGIHPHYLAFFNQASGGPDNGYKLLVDSSLDWGQDLPPLKKWLDENNLNNDSTYLAYFGTADPGIYKINTKRLPGFLDRHYQPDFEELRPGTYVISATLLQLGFQPPEAYGPWTMQQERNYRVLFQHINDLPKDSSYQRYERLRFGRLLHYLRQRQPDIKPAYSLLAYRLNDKELQDALSLPPPYNKQP